LNNIPTIEGRSDLCCDDQQPASGNWHPFSFSAT
jgi:hypothetical protein